VGNGTEDGDGDGRRRLWRTLPTATGWSFRLSDEDASRLARLIERTNIDGPSHLIVSRADLLWFANWAGDLMLAQYREIPGLEVSAEEYRAIVGRNIARARGHVHMSQRQLARHLDISRTTVGDYEHARRVLTLETVRQIAGELRVPIGLLAQEWEESPYLLVPLHTLEPRPHGG
jgi:DNA-binding XRE family transcriptional regulator